MSVEIDYALLASDPVLTSSLVSALNKSLAGVALPSFLGPISVTSFDFGTEGPDVEIVGLTDVYQEFLDIEDEEEEEDEGDDILGSDEYKQTSPHQERRYSEDGGMERDESMVEPADLSSPEENPRWTTSAPNGTGGGNSLATPSYEMNRRMSQQSSYFYQAPASEAGSARTSGTAMSSRTTTSTIPHSIIGRTPLYNSSPFTSRVGLGSMYSPSGSLFLSRTTSRAPSPVRTIDTGLSTSTKSSEREVKGAHDTLSTISPSIDPSNETRSGPMGPVPTPESSSSSTGPPDLQLHLRIRHSADIRLSLSTSLLINHPSPGFMSLPLALTVTRMDLDLHLVVAFQATHPPVHRRTSRGDPEGAGSENVNEGTGGEANVSGRRIHVSILDELDPYGPRVPGETVQRDVPHLGESKPVPVGERIIGRMEIQSSIGQEGEHVLRNVAKVERFVLELLRQTIVDELVFPSCHTFII
ncbi:mitochondrial inheritance component mdm12 [Phaffia rhodozyma]|uniref:Mitochondrial distribution and morphology protein 12 n=1 Tax=Phaffia rhodozyma TaxID=264483 RepID=A0A0F7SKF0_PHARH|nr:mitochondrial inheritance component mdm12 [Phaffia rhodozyma]